MFLFEERQVSIFYSNVNWGNTTEEELKVKKENKIKSTTETNCVSEWVNKRTWKSERERESEGEEDTTTRTIKTKKI